MELSFGDQITKMLNYEFMGIKLIGPATFCIKAIVIYFFIRIITAIVKKFFRRAATHNRFIDETNANFFRRIVVTAVYIIGCSSILSLIPGMEKISNSILASAGIMAMAVGLASQEALSNIVGGLFIIFAKPFRKGDFIEVDSQITGTIDEITLRHTTIRRPDGKLVMIPNSKINSSTIINSTIIDPRTCAFVEVGVSYDSNLDHCIKVMREEVMKHPMLIDTRSEADKQKGVPQVVIRVMELGDSAITLRAWAWAASNADCFVMKCDLLKSIKERFDAEGIEIPYPYVNNIVKKNVADV